MRNIKLTFTKAEYVTALKSDAKFMSDAAYLKPEFLSGTTIGFHDPIIQHSPYNTEEVVLALVGYAIKRISFPTVVGEIAYNYPFISQMKGGINLNGYRIVDSVDLEVGQH